MIKPIEHTEFDTLVERYFDLDLDETEALELSEYIAKCPELGRRFISHSVVHIGLFGGGREGVFVEKSSKNAKKEAKNDKKRQKLAKSMWEKPGLWLAIAFMVGVAMAVPLN